MGDFWEFEGRSPLPPEIFSLQKLQEEGRVEEREGLWARRGDGVA